MSTINLSVQFTTMSCITCGCVFGMTTEYDARKRETHGAFHCPNGHSQSYTGETDAEKYRKKAAALRAKLDQERMEASTARLERDKAQKAALRLRKRAKAGVCSFCNRSFKQLAAHMECKHPGVKP